MNRTWIRDGTPRLSERGQSAVLGFIFLIGIVATASVGIFLVAGETIDSTEQQSENEQAEQSFTELSQTMLDAGTASETPQSVDLGLENDEAVVLKNTSTLTIEQNEINETETIDFGTIEYETNDGTTIAHQGGGVFAETENETRVVSAPPVSYVDNPGSETLSFPILEPSQEGAISSGEITAQNAETDVKFSNVIEEGNVTLKIEGPYYRGWETYFERQAGEDAIEEVNHDENYVRVLLTQNRLDELYEYAVVANYVDPGAGGGGIDGPVLIGDDWDNVDDEDQIEDVDDIELEPINEEIEEKVDEAEGNSDWDSLPDETVEEGQYFAGSDVTIDDDFDLSDGNITLVVDGDINIDGEVTIDSGSGDHKLTVYTTGILEMGGGDQFCVDGCHGGVHGDESNDIGASYVEIFGTDEFNFDLSGNPYGEGAIFAPGAEGDVPSGTLAWGGAIVLDELEISGGGGTDLLYDPDLEGGPNLDIQGGIPEIVYLNIVQHDVDLTD